MKIIADFHLHSKYSRATSPALNLDLLAQWARYKGITLLGTGDCTHPIWMAELKQKLKVLTPEGFYEYQGVRFWLTVEVNNMFVSGGKTKRIHNLLFLPSIEVAERLNRKLAHYGDLGSDGRPLLRLTAQEMVKMALDVSSDILVVPAHVWTPHFSIFGANSGFDTVEECFGDQAKEIFCLETGLSSDPPMNRRLSKLDRYTLISNSDSHSASRIGREANVLECEPTREEVTAVLKSGDPKKFLYTIEFFPAEGKYHFDGHRNCKSRISPQEAQQHQNRCPVCGKKVTIGVMHRIEDLADRSPDQLPEGGVGFKRLVPFDQIIAEARGVGVTSKQVTQEYLGLVQRVGTELEILVEMPEEQLRKQMSAKIAEGVLKVRREQVEIQPGYDGEYGKVEIFKKGQESVGEKQMSFFE